MSASTSSQATSSSASAPSTSSSSGTSVPSTSVAPVPSITNLVTNSVRNNEAEFLAKLSSCSSHIDAFENPAAQVLSLIRDGIGFSGTWDEVSCFFLPLSG